MEDVVLKEIFQGTKPKKSSVTRFNIMDAYLSLMEEKDFDSIKVAEVASRANITRSTFYVYFSDIYEVIEYIENHLIDGFPSPQNAPSAEFGFASGTLPSKEKCGVPSWFKEWFDYAEQFRPQFRVLLSPYGNPQFPHKIKRRFRRALAEQMDHDGMDHDPRRDFFLKAISELHLRMLKDWVQDDAPEKMASEDFALLMNSLRVGIAYMAYLDLNDVG